ncbi:MAG: hypothetical protein H7836_07990 [Magnetococcus sp. YQC-3]
MTTIAFDGKILAADRMLTANNISYSGTKIHYFNRNEKNYFFCFAGSVETGMVLLDWIRNGENPETFPDKQKNEETWCKNLLIEDGKVYYFEMSPVRILLENKKIAIGSGLDVALYILRTGGNAIKAIKEASKIDIYTGEGINYVKIGDPTIYKYKKGDKI